MVFKLYGILSGIVSLFFEPLSDISFYPNVLPYTTSSVRVSLKITRSCLENSTNMIETNFPDNFVIKPEFKQGWTTNLKTSNIFDSYFSNVTWESNDVSNNIPNGFNELFFVWITYPSNYQVDTKYYAPTVQYCYPQGKYEWIDTTTTSETQAPYFIINSKIIYNNEETYNTFSRLDILNVSTSIITIISLLMHFWNKYRDYITNKNNNQEKINVDEKQVEITDIVV